MDTRLVSPHWVTPVVCGDLRVPASQLEVLGRMPRPDGPAELDSGPGGPCNAAVRPLSDEHCLMAQNGLKMRTRCWALLYMQYHGRGSILGRTDSHSHKGTTYSEIALKLTSEGSDLPERERSRRKGARGHLCSGRQAIAQGLGHCRPAPLFL